MAKVTRVTADMSIYGTSCGRYPFIQPSPLSIPGTDGRMSLI